MMSDLVKATGITKTFGTGATQVRAVDNVDLVVKAGELVLIMGPSGSGKTTLLMMLGGLMRPTAGSVEIDGTDLTRIPERQLTAVRRKSVGFVFQSFNLWENLSVVENVELVLNMAGAGGHVAKDRATALLEGRGLGERLRFRARDLSGGEKQRVSIARALANDPRLILADEPTANLDSKNGRAVMDVLREIVRSGDRAVVAVSHDQRIREVADRVLWLEDGKLSEIGQMARDPVCGMAVDVQSVHQLVHKNSTYYFCAAGCRTQFAEAPEKHLEPAAAKVEGANI